MSTIAVYTSDTVTDYTQHWIWR